MRVVREDFYDKTTFEHMKKMAVSPMDMWGSTSQAKDLQLSKPWDRSAFGFFEKQ